jgi:hypothetical protein
MKINHLFEQRTSTHDFMKVMQDFLPVAMNELGLDNLPQLVLELYIHDPQQPTFGKFVQDENRIHLGIENRHPLDVIRTLAHELVHYKQGLDNKLGPDSGATGSPIENEAHEKAGIIMRNFNKAHPEYFKEPAIQIKEGKYSGPMEPLKATGKEKPGAVSALERALVTAKKDGKEMNYKNIDALMQKICKAHNITGQKLHDEFVKANKLIPDNWIKKQVDEDWQKTNKHDKTDGMSQKAVNAYRKENPGSKLKTAVTKKPSELKKGSKDANRRKSFCARMGGMKKHNASAKTKRDPDSPINKALRRWNCESIEEMQELIMLGESHITNLKENFADGKNPGRKGLAKRSGVNTKASVSDLRDTAKHSTGEKARMAHWLANMKAGKAKKK